MTKTAKGRFSVQSTPDGEPESIAGGTLGRVRIEKRFEGDLAGTSRVNMLTAMTAVKGSAGYVAIEHVTGTLAGQSGTFVCQHSGTMNRGKPQLTITVVPDSGTGALTGLSGTMRIDIVEGQHEYVFAYELCDATADRTP